MLTAVLQPNSFCMHYILGIALVQTGKYICANPQSPEVLQNDQKIIKSVGTEKENLGQISATVASIFGIYSFY